MVNGAHNFVRAAPSNLAILGIHPAPRLLLASRLPDTLYVPEGKDRAKCYRQQQDYCQDILWGYHDRDGDMLPLTSSNR